MTAAAQHREKIAGTGLPPDEPADRKCLAAIDGEFRWLHCRVPDTSEQAYRLAARVGRLYRKTIVSIPTVDQIAELLPRGNQ